MSLQKQVKDIIQAARDQGFMIDMQPNGHFLATAPPGVSGIKGNQITIAQTPGSQKGATNVRARLISIGFMPPERLAAMPKHKRPGYEEPEPKPAPTTSDTDSSTDTEEGSGQMVKFSDAVRVTGDGDHASLIKTRDTLPINQILEDVPLASWLVWQRIQEKIKKGPHAPEPHTLAGRPGWEWEGSRQRLITEVWPDLPRPDYSVSPSVICEERRAIGQYLSGSKNMAPIISGSKDRMTLWWVSRTWNDADVATATRDAVGNWWERKVTPEEAGETRAPAPVLTLHRCDQCSYQTRSAGGLAVHKSKYRTLGRPHPGGREICTVARCPEIRPDVESLVSHIRRDHPGVAFSTCRKCWTLFFADTASDARAQLMDHHAAYHYVENSRNPYVTREAKEALARAAASKPEPEPEPEPEPAPKSALVTPTIEPVSTSDGMVGAGDNQAVAYLQGLLNEITRLRTETADVSRLRKLIETLTNENAELREREQQLIDWIKRYPFGNI